MGFEYWYRTSKCEIWKEKPFLRTTAHSHSCFQVCDIDCFVEKHTRLYQRCCPMDYHHYPYLKCDTKGKHEFFGYIISSHVCKAICTYSKYHCSVYEYNDSNKGCKIFKKEQVDFMPINSIHVELLNTGM